MEEIETTYEFSERPRDATPRGEFDRRCSAVREAMDRGAVTAVLIVHSHVDCLGGYAKYFCDWPPLADTR